MKNLLGKNEFKQLRRLDTYDALYEAEGGGGGMDFSNRTGWSQSLVGRAVNKIFSAGKIAAQMIVLKRLKNALDDEYMNGLLLTMKQYNVNKQEAITEKTDEELEEDIKEGEKSEESELTETQEETQTQVQKPLKEVGSGTIEIKKYMPAKELQKAIEYQEIFLKSFNQKIDASKITEDGKALLAHIDKKLELEISKVSNERALGVLKETQTKIKSLMSSVKGTKTISEQEYETKLVNFETKKREEKEKEEKEKEEMFQKLKTKYEESIKTIKSSETSKKLKTAYHEFTQKLHPDRAKFISFKDAKKAFEIFNKVLDDISVTTESLLIESYVDDLYDYCMNLNEQISDIFKSSKTIRKQKLRNLIGVNDKNKDVMSEYGDISVADFDPYKAIETKSTHLGCFSRLVFLL